MAEFAVVIPARFASERLPGKPLRAIAGRPLVQHVWRRATESDAAEVVIATDDRRVADAADAFGATVCMTSAEHQSGTDRIAEAADLLEWPDARIVVNLQGDEPLMPAVLINQCALLLNDASADLSTLASPLASADDWKNPHVVKVIVDANRDAIYFSRAAIPFSRSADTDELAWATALHHHGIYGYRCAVLRRLVAESPTDLERCERLEQLRALSLGMTIKVGVPESRPGPGVDTQADLAEVAKLIG